MDTHRWRQIDQLCHEALEREPAARVAFLDDACGRDCAARWTRNLRGIGKPNAFFEGPAIRAATTTLWPTPRSQAHTDALTSGDVRR